MSKSDAHIYPFLLNIWVQVISANRLLSDSLGNRVALQAPASKLQLAQSVEQHGDVFAARREWHCFAGQPACQAKLISPPSSGLVLVPESGAASYTKMR